MVAESTRADLGRRVRELRVSRGLSQVDLAHKARMSRVFVGDVENGHKSATVETLEKLARALDVTIAELFSGSVKTANPRRSSVREKALSRLEWLLESAPEGEVERFQDLAESFFKPYRPRRRAAARKGR